MLISLLLYDNNIQNPQNSTSPKVNLENPSTVTFQKGHKVFLVFSPTRQEYYSNWIRASYDGNDCFHSFHHINIHCLSFAYMSSCVYRSAGRDECCNEKWNKERKREWVRAFRALTKQAWIWWCHNVYIGAFKFDESHAICAKRQNKRDLWGEKDEFDCAEASRLHASLRFIYISRFIPPDSLSRVHSNEKGFCDKWDKNWNKLTEWICPSGLLWLFCMIIKTVCHLNDLLRKTRVLQHDNWGFLSLFPSWATIKTKNC